MPKVAFWLPIRHALRAVHMYDTHDIMISQGIGRNALHGRRFAATHLRWTWSFIALPLLGWSLGSLHTPWPPKWRSHRGTLELGGQLCLTGSRDWVCGCKMERGTRTPSWFCAHGSSLWYILIDMPRHSTHHKTTALLWHSEACAEDVSLPK